MKTFLKTRGRPVATLAEGAVVGKLDDFLFDLESGRVYGFRIKQGVLSRSAGVAASDVALLGRDLVYVKSEAAVDWSGVSRVREDGRAWASQYRGVKVMSLRGAALGTVEDFVLGAEPFAVVALLLDGNRIVRMDNRVSLGRDAVIVADAADAAALDADEPETTDWWNRVRGVFAGDKKDERKDGEPG